MDTVYAMSVCERCETCYIELLNLNRGKAEFIQNKISYNTKFKYLIYFHIVLIHI